MLFGIGVLLTAMMGTSVQHVASTVYFVFFLASFSVLHKWPAVWRQLRGGERLVLAGFMLYAFSGVLAWINVQDVDEYIKDLERYLRFLLAVPMYLFIRHHRVNALSWLYAGAILSGPYLFYVALDSYLSHPQWPARGYYHHIIFGSVAMLNVGVMLSLLLTCEGGLRFGRVRIPLGLFRLLLSLSMAGGLTAAALSQSRGVWLALPVYCLIALVFAWRNSRAGLLSGLFAVLLLVGAGLFSSSGEMITSRIDSAISEVNDYYTKSEYRTSLGTRLAMWEIAIEVWRQHPLVGTGPGDFDGVVRDLQKQGRYVGMDIHESTHNIFFQAVVNAGTVGLIAMLLGLFVLPGRWLSRFRRSRQGAFLTGIVVLTTFAVVGLGESWTLRLPTVSVYIAYMLVILGSLVDDGQQVAR